jgi:hypothetical protein
MLPFSFRALSENFTFKAFYIPFLIFYIKNMKSKAQSVFKVSKTNLKKKTFLFLSLIFLSGCVAKSSLVNKNPYVIKKIIQGNVNEIRITDLRKDVTNKEIVIPIITFPGMKDETSLSIQEKTLEILKKEVAKHFSESTDTTYNVEIKIIKGLVGFKAYVFSEKEFTDVDINILTKDQFGNTRHYNSRVYLEVKSLDASRKYLQNLFERALINAIYKGFEGVE